MFEKWKKKWKKKQVGKTPVVNLAVNAVPSSSKEPVVENTVSKELIQKTLDGVKKLQSDIEGIRVSHDKTYDIVESAVQKNHFYMKFYVIIFILLTVVTVFFGAFLIGVQWQMKDLAKATQEVSENQLHAQEKFQDDVNSAYTMMVDEMRKIYRKNADLVAIQQGFSETVAKSLQDQTELLHQQVVGEERAQSKSKKRGLF